MKQARAKLVGDSGRAQRLIQSRRGYGYRFVGAVAVERRAGGATPRQEGPSLVAAGAVRLIPGPGRAACPAGSWRRSAAGQTALPSVPEPASRPGVPWPGTARRRAAPAHRPLL